MGSDENPAMKSAEAVEGESRSHPRRRILLFLVLCCLFVLLVWHQFFDADPIHAESLALQDNAISRLKSEKVAERLAALNDLVMLEMRDKGDYNKPIPPLIQAIKDPDPRVRAAAIGALGGVVTRKLESSWTGSGIQPALDVITECLKDPDPGVRASAVRLVSTLTQKRASLLAHSSNDQEAVIALVSERLKDTDPRVRSAAVFSLASLAPMRFTLTEHLKDPDPSVRHDIISAISARMGMDAPPNELLACLNDESAKNRVAAFKFLPRFTRGLDPWIPKLFELAENDPDPKVRVEARNLFFSLSIPSPATSAVVPLVVTKLRSSDPEIRYCAALFLYRMGTQARAAIPELIRLLNEPLAPALASPELQAIEFTENKDPGSIAATALGKIAPGSAEASQTIAALTEMARSGPLIRRIRTVYALGEFKAAAVESIPVLIGVLKDPTTVKYIKDEARDKRPILESAHMHGEAETARAIGKISLGTPREMEGVAALRTVLDSPAVNSRIVALEALGHLGPKAKSAVRRVRELENDPEKEVKDAARRALDMIEGKR